eukprot:82174-Chlamydomonas_euryale.AAC.1
MHVCFARAEPSHLCAAKRVHALAAVQSTTTGNLSSQQQQQQYCVCLLAWRQHITCRTCGIPHAAHAACELTPAFVSLRFSITNRGGMQGQGAGLHGQGH